MKLHSGFTPRFAVLVAAVSSLLPLAAVAAPHAPIVINGDAQFTAANGVSNPAAAGTAADPYILRGLVINGGGTGICVQVLGTSKFFEIRNLGCTNAAIGVQFGGVSNGKLLDSGITQIRGIGSTFGVDAGVGIEVGGSQQVTLRGNTISNVTGGIATTAGRPGGPAWGVRIVFSDVVTITNNRFLNLVGSPATIAGAGNAGDTGGPASGIFGVFSVNLAINQNTFDMIHASAGGLGGVGAAGPVGGDGGDGGNGGDASAVLLSGVNNATANNNIVRNLFGGTGGLPGRGGAGTAGKGGNGGDGGSGGTALGLMFYAVTGAADNNNNVQRALGGVGALGGAGGTGAGAVGGNGGNGGSGGEAAGVRFDFGSGSTTQSNAIAILRGGLAGSGAPGGLGSGGIAAGGNGGKGGNGVGLHFRGTSGFTQTTNAVINNVGGLGGIGAVTGGANGTPGSSVAVLID